MQWMMQEGVIQSLNKYWVTTLCQVLCWVLGDNDEQDRQSLPSGATAQAESRSSNNQTNKYEMQLC